MPEKEVLQSIFDVIFCVWETAPEWWADPEEIMLDPIMEPHDCRPFVPILKEAGGYFGDWRGNRTVFGHEGLATNGALQQEVPGLLAL